MRTSIATITTVSLMATLLCGTAAWAQAAPGARQQQKQQRPADKASEVTVTGSRPAVIDLPDRLSFNVANDLGAQTGSLADALRNVPGVEVDLQGGVSLRGDPGVTILIDGRPSAMLRGEGRGDALLSMPANQIERVEVITNPSAAFSPEGSGGVINLITRKARATGTSGTARVTAGPDGGGLSLNAARTSPGLTLSGEAGMRRFHNEIEVEQQRERIDPVAGANLTSRQESRYRNKATSANARVAVEHDLDKNNRVTGDVTYRTGGVDSKRRERYTGNDTVAGFERHSDTDVANNVTSLRSSWRRTLPGKEHSFVAELEADRGKFERRVDGENVASTQPSLFERIDTNGKRADTRLKLDYKKPLGEERSLNVGYEGELSDAKFEFRGARGGAPGALLVLPGLTNDFDYRQMVHALFGTYQLSAGRWDFQPGLRIEQVDLGLRQRTDDMRFEQDYLRFYPTLHVGRSLTERTKLRASYSRRIQRPNPLELNPYLFYIDPQNQRRGNPLLKPETTDAFEVSAQYRKDSSFLSLTGFYRRSKDGFTDVIEALGDGVLLSTRANLGSNTRLGADAIVNGRIGKKLNYNLSATLQRVELDPGGLGGLGRRSDVTASGRANFTWQPTAKDYFQLNGNYSGKQLLPQGYRLAGGILNLGYRRKVNDRLSLLLTGQNILDSAKQEVVIRTPILRDRLEQRVSGRIFMAALSYNFGGANRKPKEPAFDFDPGATSVGQ
jgi:outer membrane receptor protein involved in Fe transport